MNELEVRSMASSKSSLNMKIRFITSSKYYRALFALSIVLKQFYLLPSGSIQIGDCLILLSFLTMIIHYRTISIEKHDAALFFFVGVACVINSVYFIAFQEIAFIVDALYLLFNLLVVLIFRKDHDEGMMKILLFCCKLNMLLQLIIFASGQGRWFAFSQYGKVRYQGTFNDPNQFAFAVFSWYLIICCIENERIINRYIFYTIALFLIYQSGSMGMMVGISFAMFFDLVFQISVVRTKRGRFLYFAFATIGLFFIIFFFIRVYTSWSTGQLGAIEMFRRLTRKFSSGKFINSFIVDRNLDNVIHHPLVMLYGGGSAHMERFAMDGDTRELHSTWIALLFYFGIVPFSSLMIWLYYNLRGIAKNYYPPVIALSIEALTLVNFRQPTFWLLFILVGYCSEKFDIKRLKDRAVY